MTRLPALLPLALCVTVCFQGMLTADQTKVIESFHVKSDIRFRLATTQIESVVRNTADKAQEIFFDVTLPKEAFIISFSMEIDGKVYNGEVKEKTEAKKTYIAAVERGDTAGHIKQAARHANVFEVSVNVANGSAATFLLTYQEMLHRKLHAYQHEIHISPGQAVKDFLIEVFIQENKPLKFVKTPALQTGSLLTNRLYVDEKISAVDRPSPNTAYITYRPSLSDQGESGLAARFIVEYDVEHSLKGDVLVVDGYFVHFFAPDISPMPKDIVFILDVSGSMLGQKMQQMKDAMLVILGDLQPDDRFNIITFSSSVNKWESNFAKATPKTIEKAQNFIKTIVAMGGTNINSALETGIQELKRIEDQHRVGLIFFLTDGEPTEGITDFLGIAANILETNGNTSAIFGLAFGKYADYDLLTKISNQNSGFARKIYEDSDAALQVASLYKEISAVSIKHLSFEYLPSSVDEYTVTDKKFPVILTGTEVIVCGRLADNAEVFHMEMTGVQKSGPLNVILEIDNVTDLVIDVDETANTFFTMPRDFSGIVEKMWAYLTIKQYLKEKEIYASNETKVEELKRKILQTAIKYKFVTPLTSMVVTKPESLETPVESVLKDADDRWQSNQPSGRPLNQHISGIAGPRKYASQQKSFMPAVYDYRAVVHSSPGFVPNYHRQDRKYTKQRMRPVRPSMTTSPADVGHRLSAIIVYTKNLSVCLAPKRIKAGTYELFRTPSGTKVSITSSCSGKNCKNFLIQGVFFNNNGSIAELLYDVREGWVKRTEYTFNFTHPASDRITVHGVEIEMTIIRTPNNDYVMDIKLPPLKGCSGLIGSILNLKKKQLNKWQKAQVPATCKDKSTVISKFLNNKMMARYKSVP